MLVCENTWFIIEKIFASFRLHTSKTKLSAKFDNTLIVQFIFINISCRTTSSQTNLKLLNFRNTSLQSFNSTLIYFIKIQELFPHKDTA